MDDQAMNRRGVLITIEGIEGCGKTTQSRLLFDYLKSMKVDAMLEREPGGSAIGDKIRGLLLDKSHDAMDDKAEALLYAASRSQLIKEVIAPAIEQSKVVILDRYIDSTIAYQVYGRGLDRQIVEEFNRWVVSPYYPDLTILLEIEPGLGLARLRPNEADRIELESESFHQRVAKGFKDLARENPDRFRVIDGSMPIEAIHAKIIELISGSVVFNA